MALIEIQQQIKAHSKVVWEVVSDLDNWDSMAPYVEKVEMLGDEKPGLSRRVYDQKGRNWLERLDHWEEGKSFSFEIDTQHSDMTFPFEGMRATTSIFDESGGVLIHVQIDYTPRFGPLGNAIDRFTLIPRIKSTAKEVLDNWVRQIYAREWAHRITVASIIKDRVGSVFSVAPDTSIIDAAHILKDHRIGTVVVLEADGSLAGVMSERDIVRAISEIGAEALKHPVKDIMTKNVVVCDPQDNMVLVMSVMTDRRIRHLPVMDGQRCIGVVSIGDVVKARIQELENRSATMREYLKGRQLRDLFRQIGPAAYERDKRPGAAEM